MMSFKYLLLISNQRKKPHIPKPRKKPGKLVAMQNKHGFGHHAFKRMQRTPIKLKASYACKEIHYVSWHIELRPEKLTNYLKIQ